VANGHYFPVTIRIGALLLYCLSLWLLYQVATRLFSPAVGHMTIALVTLMPLLTFGFGILTSPDNGLIVFWSATLLVAAWEFFPLSGGYSRHGWSKEPYNPSWRLALLGVTVGLACLSKYHGFVLGFSLVGFCLTCSPYRRALISPWTLAALLLFILTLFPLWYWNSQHDWISFRFQLLMRFDGDTGSSSFSLLQMVGYWLISIAYLFPLLGFPLWWVTFREILRQVQFYLSPTLSWDEAREHHQRFLILWLSLPIMVGFTLLGGKQQIFPAWPAPGLLGHVYSISGPGGNLAAATASTHTSMALGVRIVSRAALGSRPLASAVGSLATAGKLFPLWRIRTGRAGWLDGTHRHRSA
jgi:4-amino-4-deoxy-L-arabinose transferase-like glycosyltransferase